MAVCNGIFKKAVISSHQTSIAPKHNEKKPLIKGGSQESQGKKMECGRPRCFYGFRENLRQ